MEFFFANYSSSRKKIKEEISTIERIKFQNFKIKLWIFFYFSFLFVSAIIYAVVSNFAMMSKVGD